MDNLTINEFWETLQDYKDNFPYTDLYWSDEVQFDNLSERFFQRFLYSEHLKNPVAIVNYTKVYADDGIEYTINILCINGYK